jgi:plastocyanin
VRVPLPLTLLAVIALAAACGGGSPATTGPTSTGPGATATPGGTVAGGEPLCNDGGAGTPAEIFDFGFQPSPVVADAELTVTWTNTGGATHTITFDSGKDCGRLASSDTLSVLFPGPGSYPYHCDIHKTMKGTVTVN